MSSSDFVHKLEELGYGKPLTPAAVSWIFDYPATQSILTYICKHLSSKNAVTEDELVRYNELQTEGSVLEGDELKQAASTADAFNEGNNADDLEAEIARLESQLGPAKLRLQQLVSQRDQFSSRLMYLNHRTSKLGDPTVKSEERAGERERDMVRARERMQQAMQQLASSSATLVETLDQWQWAEDEGGERRRRRVHRGDDDDDDDDVPSSVITEAPLLGQTDLSKYCEQDRTFLRELNAYFKKQFHQGVPSVMDKEKDVPASHIYLDISEPTSLLIKGESKEVYAKYCAELARLRSILPTSHAQHTAAVLAAAETEAAIRTLEEQTERDSHYRALGLTALRQKIDELTSRVQQASRQLQEVRDDILPSLYRSLADLEAAPVLHGDYELKIKRQDYHLEKQDFVAGLLLGQLARHKVLLQALDAEESRQRQTHHLLSGIARELQVMVDEVTPRIALMDQASRPVSERKTIDDRDAVLTSAYEMLTGEKASEHAYIRHDHLIDAARELMQRIESAQAQVGEEDERRTRELKALRQHVETLSAQLFHDATAGEPSLTPVPLRDVHQRLEKSMQELARELDAIMKDRTAKQETLAQFPQESNVERRLFVAFMTAPDRLRTALDQLRQKVKAHQVTATATTNE